MGINVNGLRFLLYAKASGVDYSKTAMIGRQGLHLSFKQFCHVIRTEFSYESDTNTLKEIYKSKYADGLLRYLGAHEVDSFDFSEYENPTYTHDFNESIPEKYTRQYTAIVEGGTLEHIFNFPVAIKNCMRMLKSGGHYLGLVPANNYMGHGFYQFSPELYFRVFSKENGFCLEDLILHEGRETNKWYRVSDPKDVRHAVGVINATRTILLVLAKKLDDCPIFSSYPQQSGFVSRWERSEPTKIMNPEKPRKQLIKSCLPESFRNIINIALGRNRKQKAFRPFNPHEARSRPDKAQ